MYPPPPKHEPSKPQVDQTKFTSLIIYEGCVYRTAGFRHPKKGESFVGVDGRVKYCPDDLYTADRLILREVVNARVIRYVLTAVIELTKKVPTNG